MSARTDYPRLVRGASAPTDATAAAAGTLHDQIYAFLRRALVNGDYAPGQAFTMRALALRFGTSLIPVRDALKRLVAEGALELRPDRTICVPLMTRARFQELLQVRLSLEGDLARRATEFLGEPGIRDLEALNEEMQRGARTGDVTLYLTSNYAFHHRLYSASQSRVALPIVETLWVQAGPFLNGVFTARGTSAAKDNHGEVLRALRRRDPQRAAQAIAADLGDAADIILASAAFVLSDEAPSHASVPQSTRLDGDWLRTVPGRGRV